MSLAVDYVCAQVAGAVCGVLMVGMGHPLDTIRVWYQTGNVKFQNLASIPNPKQILSLYRGILPPLFMNGTLVSIGFGFFTVGQQYTQKEVCDIYPIQMLAGGTAATIATAPMSFGMVYCKTQQQLLPAGAGPAERSLFTIGKDLVTQPRLWGRRGLTANLLWDCSCWTGWVGTYRLVLEKTDNPMLAGACGGAMGTLVAQPFDLARSTMIAGQNEKWNTGGIYNCMRHIVQNHGWKGLMRGYPLQFVRASSVHAVSLPAYDYVFDLLRRRFDET